MVCTVLETGLGKHQHLRIDVDIQFLQQASQVAHVILFPKQLHFSIGMLQKKLFASKFKLRNLHNLQ